MKNEKTFCVLPFFGIFLSTMNKTSVSPCCVSNTIEESNRNTDEILDLYNREKFKKLRSNLLNGIQDKGCVDCWKNEEKKLPSIRQTVNKDFLHNIDNVNNLVSKIVDNDFNVTDLYTLDFFPSNYCNFRCRMCGPGASSKWDKVFNLEKNSVDYQFNEKLLYKIISNSNLFKLNITGGETVLQKQVYKLVKYIKKNNLETYLKNTIVEFVTNCSFFPESLLNDFNRIFKETRVTLSLDGIDKTLEYQRHDANWSVVEKNAQRYLSMRRDNFSVVVNCVITLMNINDIDRFVEWCFSHQQPDIFFTPVRNVGLGIELIEIDKPDLLEKLRYIEDNLEQITNGFRIFDKEAYIEALDRIRKIIKIHRYVPNNQEYLKLLETQNQLFSDADFKKQP